MTLDDVKRSILADGIIDEMEVEQLRQILFADARIDQEEADLLFELNDAVSGKKNHPSWIKLFVSGITSYLLEDGTIDAEETEWLVAKLQGDGKIDEAEKALLDSLKAEVKQLPQAIQDLM